MDDRGEGFRVTDMQRNNINPQALWHRYILALALVASFLVASHVVALMTMSGGEENSKAINISGRQRMLSQRILGLAEREQVDPSNKDVSEALDASIDLFVQSHRALTEGGDLGLTAKGAQQRLWIYETNRNGVSLNMEVEQFLQGLLILRGEVPGDREAARAMTHDLEVTDHFLASLDDAVRQLEGQAVAGVGRLRQISHAGLLAALLILLVEARFIFWPAQRAVARSFDEMMTSLDAAEDAENKLGSILKARTSFFANMSEDLQTPLRILRGYVEQVLKADLPNTVARQLSLVQRASEQMSQIINDVMDVRLLEEGLIEIEEQPVELTPVVDDVMDVYRQRAERKGVVLKKDLSAKMPEWIMADPKRLVQILDNLLSNAVKFTHEGNITVRIGHFRNERWALEVVDTGDGISFVSQDDLFRRFIQKPGEPGRATGGTGLGLPICHDLTRLMGGQMSVESVPGHGSTFRVVLPLKPAPAPPGSKKEASGAAAA
ncbi:MAG: ATP-binding protein [Pseudomonadota bacterium]